ncbi:hypothetical protein ACVBEF_14100 [Glaciimonas sp. GG7]
MSLLDNIVDVFDLPNDDRDVSVGIDLIDRRLVGITFIYRDFFRNAMRLHGLVKKRFAATLSHLAVNSESVVLLSLPTD